MSAHRGDDGWEGVEELAGQINEHHDYIESAGTLTERRRRNLMNEVFGTRDSSHAPKARAFTGWGRAMCASCSSRSSSGSSIRHQSSERLLEQQEDRR